MKAGPYVCIYVTGYDMYIYMYVYRYDVFIGNLPRIALGGQEWIQEQDQTLPPLSMACRPTFFMIIYVLVHLMFVYSMFT